MTDPDAPEGDPSLAEAVPLTFPGTGSNDVQTDSPSPDRQPTPPPKPKKPGWKPPRIRLSLKRPNLALGWQTRFKVAVVLSFVTLVTVMIMNRANQEPPRKKTPSLVINAHPKSSKPDAKPPAKKPSRPESAPVKVVAATPDSSPRPPRKFDPSVLEGAASEPPAVEPIRRTAILTEPPAPKSETRVSSNPVEPSNIPPQPPEMRLTGARPNSRPVLDQPPAPPDETEAVETLASMAPSTPESAGSIPPDLSNLPPTPLTEATPAPTEPVAPSPGESIAATPDLSLDMGASTPRQPPSSPEPAAISAVTEPVPVPNLDLGASAPSDVTEPAEPSNPDPAPGSQPLLGTLAPPASVPADEPMTPAFPVAETPAAPPDNHAPALDTEPDTPGPNASLAIVPGALQLEQPPPSTGAPADNPAPVAPEMASTPPARASDSAPVGGRIDPITHVVRRGETFYSISRYYYGSGRFYRALWMANRDQAPDLSRPLWVGSAILVPAPEDLDRSYIDPPRPLTGSSNDSSRGASTPLDEHTERTSRFMQAPSGESPLALPRSPASEPLQESPTLTPAAPRYQARVHVVSGAYETLRGIARQELGDPDLDQELLKLNSDRIDDPNHLPVGVKVRLPER